MALKKKLRRYATDGSLQLEFDVARVEHRRVIRFLGGTDFRNFSGTASDLPSGFVPIRLNYGDISGEANLVLRASGGGLPGGVVPPSFLFVAPDDGLPNEFLSPAGDFSTLLRNPDGTFTRTFKDGTAHHFDASGLQTAAGDTLQLSYDPSGRRTGIVFPNGVATSRGYDARGRLTSLSHALSGADLARFSYGYDAAGNIVSIGELGRKLAFAYDLLGRLTTAGSTGSPESYRYDASGNRAASHLSSLHLHDAGDQLLADAEFTYTYDLAGNRVARTEKATGGVTGYTYDALNQLVRLERPDGVVTSYRYDGLARRIEKDSGGSVTRYVYNREDVVLEFNGANTLAARYTHGADTDQPLSQQRGGQSYFYHGDHQGSIRRISDGSGQVVNSYDYDAYGQVTARTGTRTSGAIRRDAVQSGEKRCNQARNGAIRR